MKEQTEEQSDTRPIRLSSKTLVHISSGLYRSTANALKELISNSFDADATQVRIDTNYPEFDVLSCSDNGTGIKRSDFEKIMESIGNSLKRVGEESEPKLTASGRPVIGRLGIGLLAIAQLCYKFTVESHHKVSETAFLAELNLDPSRINKITEDTSTDEAELIFDIGFYRCEDIPFDSEKSGVLIITDDLNDTYTRRYKEDVKRDNFRPVPLDFRQFLKEVTNPKHKTIRSLGYYWQIFWELSIACPVPYLADGPFDEPLVKTAAGHDSRNSSGSSNVTEAADKIIRYLRQQLVSYNFNVVVDGVSLRKPLQIPDNAKADGRLTPIEYSKKVRGKTLSLKGYIYTQHGAIYPSELRGMLVRVRNIAVGSYDTSFLDLATVQGFRFDWMSGEVYVSQGLEDALNIDRYSFNEVNPHYLALQKEIHNALEAAIREARKVAEATRRTRSDDGSKPDDTKYLSNLGRVLGKEYNIRRGEDASPNGVPINIDARTSEIFINQAYPDWPKRGAARQVAEYILIALKLARRTSKDEQEIDKIALAILQEVL